MPTVWRQGDLLAPDDAVALGVIEHDQRDTHRALVISHSCDIASAPDVEPKVELLRASVVLEAQAKARNGHSIRRLDIPANGTADVEWLQLGIADRELVNKGALLDRGPWKDRRIPATERGVLRRWLAQRYSRSEFPDAFVDWLGKSGVEDRLERLAKRESVSLVGIYFDLDDDIERTDTDDPYTLGIILVYSTLDASHAARADTAVETLTSVFSKRCRSAGRWKWIELLYCEAIADTSFSLQAANTFRRWRLEHRSLAGEPLDESE